MRNLTILDSNGVEHDPDDHRLITRITAHGCQPRIIVNAG